MYKLVALILIVLCLSCKRNYKCNYTKTDANQNILNETQFKIKAKDSKEGYQACVNKYLDANPAPGVYGEISCDIK